MARGRCAVVLDSEREASGPVADGEVAGPAPDDEVGVDIEILNFEI
jgi:hypothetical protein